MRIMHLSLRKKYHSFTALQSPKTTNRTLCFSMIAHPKNNVVSSSLHFPHFTSLSLSHSLISMHLLCRASFHISYTNIYSCANYAFPLKSFHSYCALARDNHSLLFFFFVKYSYGFIVCLMRGRPPTPCHNFFLTPLSPVRRHS